MFPLHITRVDKTQDCPTCWPEFLQSSVASETPCLAHLSCAHSRDGGFLAGATLRSLGALGPAHHPVAG